MNNKIITLGTVNMDWHYAKGNFSCKCANTEDTNAFDRAICGILYKSSRQLLKTDIASILGFNILDRPQGNQYCDQSEKAIFDNAVSSLVEYGLVEDKDDFLIITESGKSSYETRKKQHVEERNVDLWVDEFAGVSFHSNMIKGLQANSTTFEKDPNWNLLIKSPRDVLKTQKGELVNVDAGKSVISIIPIGIEYYVAKLECLVCYNVETGALHASSISGSQDTDNIILNNESLQNKLLERFFKGKNASVIYKQTYQEEMENNIKNTEAKDIKCTNIITCTEDFKSKLNLILQDNNVTIFFISIKTITSAVKDSLRRLSPDYIICVDYVEGIISETNTDSSLISEDNICYFHVDELRTSDICVYDNTFYSILPYIVDFKGISYSIPLIFEYKKEKYNNAALYAPFANHIIKRAIDIIQIASEDQNKKTINKVLKIYEDINKINLFDEKPKFFELTRRLEHLSRKMREDWNTNLYDRLKSLETDVIGKQNDVILRDALRQIQSDINATNTVCDEDVIKLLSEVKQRIENPKLPGPKIKHQTIYILDTSMLMDKPKILSQFNLINDKVVIPRAMEQELDGLTHDPNKKEKAVEALRLLRKKLSDNPQCYSIYQNVNRDLLPPGFDPTKNDNDMLATSIEMAKNDNVEKVVIVSNDKEFVANIKDCTNSGIISNRIEGINLDELLIRLGD